MKILVLSDLHMEYVRYKPPAHEADMVVLAGDIDGGAYGVEWALKHFTVPVVYVPGNHEFYGSNLEKGYREIEAAAKGSHVHVLNNSMFEYQGVRFLGATLWTDYRLTGNEVHAEIEAHQVLKDFELIRNRVDEQLFGYQLRAEFASSKEWLASMLRTEYGGKTVVVTHHAPTQQSMAAHYREAKGHLNASFASNLEHFIMEHDFAVWIHGHLHSSSDYLFDGKRIVCNPKGNPKFMNPDFEPLKIIEV